MQQQQQQNGRRKKDGGVEAPLSLGGFFNSSNDGEEDEEGGEGHEFEQIYDEQVLQINSKDYIIRQYCWHQVNANKVWPGTFNLAEFIEKHSKRYTTGIILELGAATGALSLSLKAIYPEYPLYTSDIDDGGEVQENIQYNFHRNGVTPVPHIPHTWGTPWPEDQISSSRIRYIIASDILLYVSAYPALVQTLLTLFYGPNHKISLQPLSSLEESLDNYVINLSNSSSSDDINYELYDAGEVAFSSHLINTLPSSIKTQNEYPIEFLMSWNRRISESYKFFQMMHAAGFICYHHGSCIYSFVPTLGS